MNNKSLENLYKRAKAGDKKATEEIIEYFNPLLCNYSIINNKFDEDCYQQLCVRIILCIKNFEVKG